MMNEKQTIKYISKYRRKRRLLVILLVITMIIPITVFLMLFLPSTPYISVPVDTVLALFLVVICSYLSYFVNRKIERLDGKFNSLS